MLKKISVVVFLTVLSTALAADIRVLLVKRPFFKTSEREFCDIAIPLLSKKGFVFVDKDPDLVLISGIATRNLCLDFKKFPIIILDGEESASLDGRLRRCLKVPAVKAVFKNTVLRDVSKYNETNYKYHFGLVYQGFGKRYPSTKPSFTDDELSKIHQVLWDTNRSFLRRGMEGLVLQDINFEKERPIDVFFAGSVSERRVPGIHRCQMIKALKALRGYNVVVHDKRIPKQEFLNTLKRSKIVISPWGNGEWCWRDYEAILAGAVMIKPDTSFVQAYPDLYQNDKYYVPCQSNFSDLNKKIDVILKDYSKYKNMRYMARNLLVDHFDYETQTDILANKIKEVFLKSQKDA